WITIRTIRFARLFGLLCILRLFLWVFCRLLFGRFFRIVSQNGPQRGVVLVLVEIFAVIVFQRKIILQRNTLVARQLRLLNARCLDAIGIADKRHAVALLQYLTGTGL